MSMYCWFFEIWFLVIVVDVLMILTIFDQSFLRFEYNYIITCCASSLYHVVSDQSVLGFSHPHMAIKYPFEPCESRYITCFRGRSLRWDMWYWLVFGLANHWHSSPFDKFYLPYSSSLKHAEKSKGNRPYHLVKFTSLGKPWNGAVKWWNQHNNTVSCFGSHAIFVNKAPGSAEGNTSRSSKLQQLSSV